MTETVDMNVSPGEILEEEFLKPMGISQNRLARSMKVGPRRINEIILHGRAITADTAIRLSKVFGTTPEFWMNLQAHYELKKKMAEIGNIELERLAA